MQPLVQECNALRRRMRTVQLTIDAHGDPAGHHHNVLDSLRTQHADVKRQQRQLERDLNVPIGMMFGPPTPSRMEGPFLIHQFSKRIPYERLVCFHCHTAWFAACPSL